MTKNIYDVIEQSPNFGYPRRGTLGRGGHKIDSICLHITGGSYDSASNWIKRPEALAGYNAIIRLDGTVVQFVEEQNAAWAHGKVDRPSWPLLRAGINPNQHSLSLARVGSNQNTWTPAQLRATLDVLKYWGHKYDITLKRPYVFGHFEIDSVNRWYCPGRPFFDEVIKQLPAVNSAILPKNPINEPKNDEVTWYRVVAGSYRRRENAEKQREMLQAQGINAFVVNFSPGGE